MSVPLLSICIPTYNGGNFFLKTIDSIVPYITSDVELIVSDDCSSDQTYANALGLSEGRSNVKVIRNKVNIGMDANFYESVKHASGKYIWFCGQDDQLGEEVIISVLNILKIHNISVLNLNFSQYDHEMTNCIMPSFFERASFDHNMAKASELLLFNNANDYFKVFTQPPSFLPSVVMLRQYWNDRDVSLFSGTHFVQVGLILLNLDKGIVAAYTPPLIKGRVPNDQWQADGERLFTIMTGDLKAKKIAFDLNINLPRRIYRRDKFKYLLNYPFLILHCKTIGLKASSGHVGTLRFIFGGSGIFWLYLLPFLFFPAVGLKLLLAPGIFLKRILFKFSFFERLRG